MILTGKVKEEFLKYLDVEEQWFNDEYIDLFAFELIIEWFDSLKWFINIKSKFGQRKQCERFMFHIKGYSSEYLFNSRLEAKKEAIIKTNALLNAKFSKTVL